MRAVDGYDFFTVCSTGCAFIVVIEIAAPLLLVAIVPAFPFVVGIGFFFSYLTVPISTTACSFADVILARLAIDYLTPPLVAETKNIIIHHTIIDKYYLNPLDSNY